MTFLHRTLKNFCLEYHILRNTMETRTRKVTFRGLLTPLSLSLFIKERKKGVYRAQHPPPFLSTPLRLPPRITAGVRDGTGRGGRPGRGGDGNGCDGAVPQPALQLPPAAGPLRCKLLRVSKGREHPETSATTVFKFRDVLPQKGARELRGCPTSAQMLTTRARCPEPLQPAPGLLGERSGS